MTMTIKTKDNGKTTVRINAATIAEAIRQLDHTRAALCEMNNALSNDSMSNTESLPCHGQEAVSSASVPVTAQSEGTNGNPPIPPTPQYVNLEAIATEIMTRPTHAAPLSQAQPDPKPKPVDTDTATHPEHAQSEAHLIEQVRSKNGTPLDIPLSSDDPDDAPPPTVEELRADINANGKQLFPNAWDKACPWLIGLWTAKNTPTNQRSDLNQLNAEECTQVLCGMIEHAPYLQAEWQKHLQNETAKAPPTATKSSTQRPKTRTNGANGRPVAERF